MEIPYYIECILEQRKITDYLDQKGITSKRQSGDKMMFCCPLHSGDNDPSFVVYLNSQYENYYCYGCHSGGSIINLVSDIEKISIKKAIAKLASGLNIKSVDILDSVIEQLKENKRFDNNNNLEILFLKINKACYNYIRSVNYDKDEICFFEEVYKKIDKVAFARDEDTLSEMFRFLVDQGFPSRVDRLFSKKEEKMISDYNKTKAWGDIQ